MGILNVTPDSFSDGGLYLKTDLALRHAEALIKQGADIIDVGGQSTRPGAQSISVEEEIARVLPVVKALATQCKVSVDTYQPEVMKACLEHPIAMINDVSAMPLSSTRQMIAKAQVDVVLMHKQGSPLNMQNNPQYEDPCAEVVQFLSQQVALCEEDGISKSHIWVDPGIGFGKTLAHNSALLKGLSSLQQCSPKVLLGISRKSYFKDLLGIDDVNERILPSAVMAALAAAQGIAMIRTHDVQVTQQALRCAEVFCGE